MGLFTNQSLIKKSKFANLINIQIIIKTQMNLQFRNNQQNIDNLSRN